MSGLGDYFRVKIWQLDEPAGFAGTPTRLLRVVTLVVEGISRLNLVRAVAALGFVMLTGTLPLLFLGICLLKGLGVLGPVADALWPVAGTSGVSAGLREELHAFAATELDTGIWLVGLGLLITIGLLLPVMLERIFNQVWGIRRGRSLLHRALLYSTFGPAGLAFVSISLLSGVLLHSDAVRGLVGGAALLAMPTVLILAPILLACIVFTLVYLYVPNTRVPTGAAVTAGLFAGLSWEALKHFFMWSVGSASASFLVPALLSMGVLVLAWLFITALSTLLGGQLAYAVQHVKTHRRELDLPAASSNLKERVALRSMLEISRAFLRGEDGPSLESLTESLKAPLRLVSQIIYQLTRNELVREVVSGEKGTGLVPARDPAQITVHQVIDAIRTYGDARIEMPDDAAASSLDDAVDRARTRSDSALEKVNFKDLVTPSSRRSAKTSKVS